jgi:hypothetical protein
MTMMINSSRKHTRSQVKRRAQEPCAGCCTACRATVINRGVAKPGLASCTTGAGAGRREWRRPSAGDRIGARRSGPLSRMVPAPLSTGAHRSADRGGSSPWPEVPMTGRQSARPPSACASRRASTRRKARARDAFRPCGLLGDLRCQRIWLLDVSLAEQREVLPVCCCRTGGGRGTI